MEKKNLLTLDLQLFGEEDASYESGENDVEESATSQEEESTEAEESETVEEDGNDVPHEQSAEENARYAAIRRRAEEDARMKYQSELNVLNQQLAATCQGAVHPLTGRPITNVHEYVDALAIQRRQAQEQELQEKGVDPRMIDRMIATNPVVQQAQQVIEQTKMLGAEQKLQSDFAELNRLGVKDVNELVALPTFPQMMDYVQTHDGASIVEAYKIFNFDNAMQHTNDVAKQKAINQMRGKDHLSSQTAGVSQNEDYVEVPAEIMQRYKESGKTEKQIRELYAKVAKQLHLN